MKRLGWSCVLLVLCGCPQKLDGPCGGFTCTETERCEADTFTCVPNEPPEIAVIAPATVVSAPTFVLSGIITDDEAGTEAEWQVGSSAAVPLTLNEEGAFSITVDAPMLDSQSLVVTIRARDVRAETKKDVSVQIDRVGPSLRLLRPDAGSLVGAASIEVGVEAVDGSETISALSIDGRPVSMPRSGLEAVQMIAIPETHNGDPVEFEVTAADPYGNQTTQIFSFVGDRVGPSGQFTAPIGEQLISAASFMVELDISDPSGIADVTALLGSGSYELSETSPGHWTASVQTEIEEQERLLTVEIRDTAGNLTTEILTLRIDRIAPTVNVASPAAGSLHNTDLSVTVTTSTGTDSVSAVLEGQPVPLTGGPTLWNGTVAIPQRDYSSATLTVTARDEAGNEASTDVLLNVDTVAPVIAFTAPTPNQRFNASAFTTSQDVTVAWTVTDADSQAATTTVNGTASTALTTSVATTANDNPAMYSTTVAAADRAGNTASATVNWSVDRRVPTVVSWTPANNTRNVEPWESVISFSERVSGPMDTSPALIITGQTAPTTDSWNSAHTTYTLPLTSFKARALEVAISGNLTDDYGNPVAASSRRFHLATGFPSGTDIAITTGVVALDASSDSDGVVSIGVVNNTVRVLQDYGGFFVELVNPTPPANPSRVAINSANVVNPTTLESSRRLGVMSSEGGFGWRGTSVDGAAISSTLDSSPTSAVAIVSRPPLANEPTGPNATFGTIVGTTYTRGTLTRTLSYLGRHVVAQSNDSWAAFTYNATYVNWSHYRCRALITGGFNCGSIGYGTPTTAPNLLQTAMTPNGNCLAVTWTSDTTRVAVFQSLSPCDLGACFDDVNVQPVTQSLVPNDLRVAPYGVNGENTLLFSYRSGTTEFVLAKMSQTCGPGGSIELGRVPSGRLHQPVRIGNRPGLLYVNNAGHLRLYVP